MSDDDLLYEAWVVIGSLNWDYQTPEWRAAAERWRDKWHATLPRITEDTP